jgi:DNA-binding transcriptional ArsR family regulator
MKRKTTKTKYICDILSTLLGDYRLGDTTKLRKGAVLGWTASQIALNAGIPERTVYRLLKEMVEHGIIEKRGEDYKISSRILWNLYDYQNQFNKEKDKSIWLNNQKQQS